MSVRVIAGSAKGRRLRVPSVRGLRPTSDRARETIFSVLAPTISGARFLDVFAGSGAVGIEALSRGAEAVVFVERHRRARALLEENLRSCGFTERARVLGAEWSAALRRLGREAVRFDIAFFDPPYDWAEAWRCLEQLAEAELLAADGRTVLEHRSSTPPRCPTGWELERSVEVGDAAFSIFRLGGKPVLPRPSATL